MVVFHHEWAECNEPQTRRRHTKDVTMPRQATHKFILLNPSSKGAESHLTGQALTFGGDKIIAETVKRGTSYIADVKQIFFYPISVRYNFAW